MRVLLFTGKGGVGKTTAAAATAAVTAARGLRTLLVSTDAAHSLADAVDVGVFREPTPVAESLHLQQVDAQQRFEEAWAEIQGYVRSVLDAVGVDPIAAEEMTVLPGAEEVLALLEVRAQARSGRWDVVVVDCAPTAETLRLLALPEVLGWYLERIVPVERRVVKLLKPVLTKAAGVPMPPDTVFDALARLHADLTDVRDLLTGPESSVRLVLTPEAIVVAEARRSLTSLSLYGYRVDGVIANRIFPGEGADAWRQGWVRAQTQVMSEVEESFGPLRIWRAPYLAGEPVGLAALREFAAELYDDTDPVAPSSAASPVQVRREGSAVLLRVELPFADREAVDLARRAGELVITVGSYRRILALPEALRTAPVASAGMAQGALVVRFDQQRYDEPQLAGGSADRTEVTR